MGLSATMNGKLATSARVTLPAWGCWFADVTLDGDVDLTGSVELKVADLTLRGAIMSGGATEPKSGRSRFRIVGGAGGWGKTIKASSYSNDAEVKMSTVLVDAANAAGEQLDASTIPATRVGAHYARKEGPASRSLEILAPGAWYVDENGVTCIGKRPSTTLGAGVTRESVDAARGMAVLASDSIAKILPGVVVDGITAVDVEHTISAEGGLRSTIWGARGNGSSRRLAVMRRLIDALYPNLPFLGTWEYRVVTQEGKRLNLQPVRVSTGMPTLSRVPVRPGLAGSSSELTPGAHVLVNFIDGQPGRPNVVALEDAEGGGFKPLMTTIEGAIVHVNGTISKIGDGVRPIAAAGDLAGGIWPIVTTQTKAFT